MAESILETVIQATAERLMGEGAQAVVLIGSRVRGDAHPESDVDVVAVGEGADYRLERAGGFLVSISWRSADRWYEVFRTPNEAAGAIPGWRTAVLIRDPAGIAAGLQREAQAWTWESIGAEADAWVAESITGYAEEVHKLIAALDAGRQYAAAVQRDLLAVYLAVVLGVHLRILHETENHLWDLVAARMGEPWAAQQAAAFGLNGEAFEETCRAALLLYVLAAREVSPLLDDSQRAVVDHTVALAGTLAGTLTEKR